MKKDTWKDVFRRQMVSGKFWSNLLKEEFNRRIFLDRSDAVYICKKAQADAYENVISKFDGEVSSDIIDELREMINELWNSDDLDLYG